MSIVVQKYGGSSVADVERIRGVAARIKRTRDEGHGVVVVVSAMGNTTNELIALAREVSAVPARRELDMLVSVGERIAMTLLAMALEDLGVPARSLTGSQSGIITDESHSDARVVEVRPARVLQLVGEGRVVIVAGFQGVSREREVTTLGRGGSDTTAVVLAAALGAAYCEICSDVDGVWSADPRKVPGAERIVAMSLDEGLALARGGAKVLFEDALKYARDHGVALQASATFGPGAGTRLSADPIRRDRPVAVTGDDQLVTMTLTPEVTAGLVRAGARVRQRIGATVWVDLRNAHGSLDALAQAPAALVSAVGSGVAERLSTLLAGDVALAGLDVQGCGAAGDAAWWAVPVGELDEAVRRLHTALVEG